MIQRCPLLLIQNALVPLLLAVLLCENSLLRVAVSAEPAAPASDLPADGIYPQGRKLAFAGYSGDPARNLANGVTLAGLVYGNQQPYLERCFANDWPVIAHIGPSITFDDQAPNKYKLDPASLRQEVEQQVKALAVHKQIAWWAVRPEELRPWRAAEMQYLAIVCETIRENDPRGRPIYLYNPNHRTANSLEPIARHVAVLAKGCYVNLVAATTLGLDGSGERAPTEAALATMRREVARSTEASNTQQDVKQVQATFHDVHQSFVPRSAKSRIGLGLNS